MPNGQPQVQSPDVRRFRDPVAVDLTRQAAASIESAQRAMDNMQKAGNNIGDLLRVIGQNQDNSNADMAYINYSEGLTQLETKAKNMTDQERVNWLNSTKPDGFKKQLETLRNSYNQQINQVNEYGIRNATQQKVQLMDIQFNAGISELGYKSQRNVDDEIFTRAQQIKVANAVKTFEKGSGDNFTKAKAVTDGVYADHIKYAINHGSTKQLAKIEAQKKAEEAFSAILRHLNVLDDNKDDKYLAESLDLLEKMRNDGSLSDEYYNEQKKDIGRRRAALVSVENPDLVFDAEGNIMLDTRSTYGPGLTKDEYIAAIGSAKKSSKGSQQLTGKQVAAVTTFALTQKRYLEQDLANRYGLLTSDQRENLLKGKSAGEKKAIEDKHQKLLNKTADVDLINLAARIQKDYDTVMYLDRDDDDGKLLTDIQAAAASGGKIDMNRFIAVKPMANDTQAKKVVDEALTSIYAELFNRYAANEGGVYRENGSLIKTNDKRVDETAYSVLFYAFSKVHENNLKNSDNEYQKPVFDFVSLENAYWQIRDLIANPRAIPTGVLQSTVIDENGKTKAVYDRNVSFIAFDQSFKNQNQKQKDDFWYIVDFALKNNMSDEDYAYMVQKFSDQRAKANANEQRISLNALQQGYFADMAPQFLPKETRMKRGMAWIPYAPGGVYQLPPLD